MTDDRPIEAEVGDLLADREETVAVAESCTGGLIGSLLTDVSGSSEYFDRGFVTYAYGSKLQELCVPREVLDAHGAVSEPTAREMAQGVRDRAGTTWGVSSTGVAGPSGGTEETPVGTAFIGIAHAAEWGTGDSGATVERYEFDGSRTEVKRQIARQALSDLRAAVEGR